MVRVVRITRCSHFLYCLHFEFPILHFMRPPLIVGNWKMFKTVAETVKYVADLRVMLEEEIKMRRSGREGRTLEEVQRQLKD